MLITLAPGVPRTDPKEPDAVVAIDRVEAPDKFCRFSAWAPVLRTPIAAARLPETIGDKEWLPVPLLPATVKTEIDDCTELDSPLPFVKEGLLRAGPREPVAD